MAHKRRNATADDSAPAPATASTNGRCVARGAGAQGPIVADHGRYHELLAMAKIYNDWTQGQLADALGRDEHNLWPKGGVLRMDIVVRLARALDWPLFAVLEDLTFHEPESDEAAPERTREDIATHNEQSFQAYLEGRYADALRHARAMRRRAEGPIDRAKALLRESLAWEALGRYNAASESLQQALLEPIADRRVTMRLRCNLAWCHHALGLAYEGEGVAAGIIEELAHDPSDDAEAPGWIAYAHFVRGLCLRLRAETLADPSLDMRPGAADEATCVARARRGSARRRALPLARRAIEDLDAARRGLRAVALLNELPYYDGLARIADGAILALETLLGEVAPEACIERVLDELESWVELPSGGGIDAEAIGWWCIFACHVVLREIDDVPTRERQLAILSNKATEVAEATANWSLRERVFTVEFLRRAGGAERAELDVDDVRVLSGVMGRFPSFRRLGWVLVRRAFTFGRASR
ncbi:MAG TPA: hypothetical protein PKC43_00395 [Phycisphaerales bacterium]|nr:hypothetical protein [Phycisphaerales bacterium]HMP35884.1 hypothetical protein [Phycisphaerales bacterium]